MAVSKIKRALAIQKSSGLKPRVSVLNNRTGNNRNQSKYIPRPVVQKVQQKVSKECARSFNEEKKELRLFTEFNNYYSKADLLRKQEECKRLSLEISKFWRNNNYVTKKSYSSVVLESPNNRKISVIKPILSLWDAKNIDRFINKQRRKEKKNNDYLIKCIIQRTPHKLISDWSAKRDYINYWKGVQAQKEEARTLVEAIASRKPKIVARKDIQSFPFKIKQKKNFEKKKIFEVENFPEGCFYGKPEPYVERKIEALPEVKVFPYKHKGKIVKKKWDRVTKEVDRGNKPYIYEAENNRLNRRRLLIDSLSRTELGKGLLIGYLNVMMRAENKTFLDILDPLSSITRMIEPQMEEVGLEGKPIIDKDKESTSVITSAQVTDKGKPHEIIDGFHKMAVTREVKQYDTVINRWIPVDQFKWSTSDEINSTIGTIKLPLSIIRKFNNSQNFQLFYTHRFMRPLIMRLKFVLNSNRFQIGCLVADVCYMSDSTGASIFLQDNVYCALQRNHCKLMAGSSNNAELLIPFHWSNSSMKIQFDEDNVVVTLRPLNKLTVTGNVATECSVSVFLSFEEVELNGMISRELPTGQMDTIGSLLNLGSNVLNAVNKDLNRDNPPLALNPVSVIPQAMGSMAYTDYSVEPVYSLRSDPCGQVPQITENDEMSISFLRDCWSFYRTYQWSTKQENRELFSIPVAPLLKLSDYPETTIGNTPTTLAMLGSLYGRWRGDIEFKFELVMCSFYSGSFMVSSIPLIDENDKRSYQDASYSSYVVFDLNDTGERIFVAPWNWYNSFAETRGVKSFDIPSYIKGYIVNPLIAIDNVPPSIYINVYVRGGRNFEVAIPRASLLAPKLTDPIKPPEGQRPIPYDTTSRWYLTYNVNVVSSLGKYPLVPYVSNVKNGFVGYTHLTPMQLYKLSDKTTKGLPFRAYYKIKDAKEKQSTVDIRWGCYDIGLSTVNAHGMIVSWDKNDILNYIKALKQGLPVEQARSKITKAIWTGDSEWSVVLKGGKWVVPDPLENDPPIWEWVNIGLVEEDFEIIESQMNTESAQVIQLDKPSGLTDMGRLVFGERVPDLKSLCRRWNHFGSILGNTCSEGMPRDCCYSAILRLNPMKHIDPPTSSSYDNRYRNGIITAIGSMYYLYRGGLRFRFIVVGNPPEGTMMYVSHRYDLYSPSYLPVTYGNKKVRTKDDMMNTQYATHGQALTVNAVFTVEVPYYSCRERLFTSYLNTQNICDNGSLYVWIHSKVESNIHVEVYYSFADDSRFSVFQGVPICLDTSEMEPEPQMENEYGIIEVAAEVHCSSSDSDSSKSVKQKKGLVRTVKDCFSKHEEAASGLVDLTTDIKTTNSSLQELINKIREFVDTSIAKIESKLSPTSKHIKKDIIDNSISLAMDYFKELGQSVFKVVTHLIYAIISPCVATISWVLCNLYHVFFGFTLKGLDVVTNFVKDIWNRCKNGPTELSQGEEVEAQSEFSSIGAYSSLLFSIITTVCNLKMNPPTSWEGIDKGLFRFGQMTRSTHFVGKFFEDNVQLFKRIFQKLIGVFGSNTSDFELLAGVNDPRLRDWLIGSSLLIAPQSSEQIECRQDWAYKVFEYALVGRALVVSLCSEKLTPPKILQAVQNIQKKLVELEKECISRKVFSPARYEPMCTWICGKGGRGKSRLLEAIVTEYAKENGNIEGQICHTITNGQKYFDGLSNQQIVVIDDFLSTSISVNPDILDLFLQFKSCIPLNPAYSRVEDKVNRVSFKDLVISSNRIWFSNDAGIDNPEAFNRRRDVMIKIEYRDKNMTPDKFKKLPLESLKNLDEVDIFYHSSPGECNEAGWIKISREPSRSYRESVFDFLRQSHKNYHEKEQISYQQRCATIQEVLNNCDNRGSFEVALEKYKNALVNAYVRYSVKPDFSPELDRWLKRSKDAATYIQDRRSSEPSAPEEEIESQMEDFENRFSKIDLNKYSIGDIIEPGFVRGNHETYTGNKECKHRSFLHEGCSYNSKLDVFENNPVDLVDLEQEKSYSVRNGVCLQIVNVKGKRKLLPVTTCLWNNNEFRDRFFVNFHTYSEYAPKISQIIRGELSDSYIESFTQKLPEYSQNWLSNILNKNKSVSLGSNGERLVRTVENLQNELVEDNQVIGDSVLPIQSRWKTIPQKIWKVITKAFKLIWELFDWLLHFMGVLWKVALMVGLVKVGWDSYSLIKNGATPNLYGSGDYKTLKSRGGVRSRALNLVASNDDDPQELNPIELCQSKLNKRGVINKIINNSFFLVGLKEDGTSLITYKARCLGLYNRTAICLRHYVDHWKAVGCEKVALVYYKAKGYITFELKDIEFKWTEEGFGTATFPKSLPRQFAKITQFIPSERFDGNYPADCIMVEPFVEDCYQYNLKIKRLSSNLKVPANSTQSSWTITQGLEYDWGGKGRCGSFLIAPNMACPLIGIHTAGIGEKKGFSELLFRETFDNFNEPILEFVEPNMIQTPAPYGLDGEYYCVGGLEASKVPRNSNKTKIIPSVISGVFPILTEPAPLTRLDPRLEAPLDIFRIGCSKRCEPVREFNKDDIVSVARSYRDRVMNYVYPVRDKVAVLSFKEAIEGFPIEGYDPIIMSTSEGYPWTLERPNNSGSKEWMFKREEYPDGRMKIVGIYKPLIDCLKLKEKMRQKGIVPATYFTSCLKDARILKEKIPIPGKTRVFEMCPIELTIAQRQFFQDYVAGYIAAKGLMEHTIGINPDGPQWSQLANELKDFSPYILTADYSGYGPHVPHTILDMVFHHRMAWYDSKEEIDEKEKDRRFLIRTCIKEENMHGLHVVRDAVVRFASGLDSGNPSTVDLNSEVNSHLIRLAFLGLARKYNVKHCLDLYFFDKYVLLRHNGDDLIAAVKPDIIEWFNNITLIDFFSEYGLKMTDALKEGKLRPYCSIEEASYLKRGFMRHPWRDGEWLAPLEKSSITDTANWIWQSVNDIHASLVNSEMSSRLAYTRGPKYYDEVSEAIKKAWKIKGINFEYPSWSTLDNHIWEGTPGPKYSF
nr:polyprotein [Picornavirales sp.]